MSKNIHVLIKHAVKFKYRPRLIKDVRCQNEEGHNLRAYSYRDLWPSVASQRASFKWRQRRQASQLRAVTYVQREAAVIFGIHKDYEVMVVASCAPSPVYWTALVQWRSCWLVTEEEPVSKYWHYISYCHFRFSVFLQSHQIWENCSTVNMWHGHFFPYSCILTSPD